MPNNLTGTRVKDTYVKVVQVVGGKFYDGLGNAIDPKGIGLTYEHIQNTPATTWSFNHGLGRYPAVTIMDSAGTLLWAEVTYSDINTVVINFSQLTSGTASCS